MLNTSSTYHLTLDSIASQFKGACNTWEAVITVRLIEVLIEVVICLLITYFSVTNFQINH